MYEARIKMSEKLERLEARKRALMRQIREEKSKASRQKRRDDTRRKILIGSMILSNSTELVALKKNSSNDWEIVELKTAMNKYLTKKKDRELFNLEGGE
jgi:hypothetical protein